jgi:hypothetical protein
MKIQECSEDMSVDWAILLANCLSFHGETWPIIPGIRNLMSHLEQRLVQSQGQG